MGYTINAKCKIQVSGNNTNNDEKKKMCTFCNFSMIPHKARLTMSRLPFIFLFSIRTGKWFRLLGVWNNLNIMGGPNGSIVIIEYWIGWEIWLKSMVGRYV